jgi:hypothetical protein
VSRRPVNSRPLGGARLRFLAPSRKLRSRKSKVADDPEQKTGIDLNMASWEYRAGTPSEHLKSWACSYSGYHEDVGRPVCRLEVPRVRVIVILGFGDRLRINPVGSTAYRPHRLAIWRDYLQYPDVGLSFMRESRFPWSGSCSINRGTRIARNVANYSTNLSRALVTTRWLV